MAGGEPWQWDGTRIRVSMDGDNLTAVGRCCRFWNLAPCPGRESHPPSMVVADNHAVVPPAVITPVFTPGRFP